VQKCILLSLTHIWCHTICHGVATNGMQTLAKEKGKNSLMTAEFWGKIKWGFASGCCWARGVQTPGAGQSHPSSGQAAAAEGRFIENSLLQASNNKWLSVSRLGSMPLGLVRPPRRKGGLPLLPKIPTPHLLSHCLSIYRFIKSLWHEMQFNTWFSCTFTVWGISRRLWGT